MAIDKMQFVKISAAKESYFKLVDEADRITNYHPLVATEAIRYFGKGMMYPSDSKFMDLKNRLEHLDKTLKLNLEIAEDYQEKSYDDVEHIITKTETMYESFLNNASRKMMDEDLSALKKLNEYDIKINPDDFITIKFGRIPLSTLSHIASYNHEKFVYSELLRNKYYVWIVYVCLKQDEDHFKTMFKELYFDEIPIPKELDCIQDKRIDEIDYVYTYVLRMAKLESFSKYIVVDDDTYSFCAFVPLKSLGAFMETFDDAITVDIIDVQDKSSYKDILGIELKVIDEVRTENDVDVILGKIKPEHLSKLKDLDVHEVKKDKNYVWVANAHSKNRSKKIHDLFRDAGCVLVVIPAVVDFELNENKITFVEDDTIKVKEHLEIPTKLSNNWLFKPFEMLVEMYGIPKYGTFDPTMYFGITYCLLFGIMFGDVGQGLVISLIGAYMYHKRKMVLGAVMERIGVFSMLFGFVYGSFFGNEEILLPLLHPLGLPIHVGSSEMTMPLLMFAVGLGIVLILSSMLINIIILLKQKRFSLAVLSQNGVAGFMFYGFIILGAVFMLLGYPSLFTTPLLIVFVYIPLLAMLFREPLAHLMEKKKANPHGGWGGYLVESAFELFEVVLSFLTNTMSFLRVAGFILSHVGMMMVIMQLTELSGNASIIVMIFGNLLVISLEGLIVGIQTLRLEYYEMFSRYYESGGIKFESL